LEELEVAEQHAGQQEIAVLSPYSQQVVELKKELGDIRLPSGLTFKRALAASPQEGYRRIELSHTVDSFQGNEADIVIISLVRNNGHSPGEGLGFLKDGSRMNVLLSRAQRLLILVGSWDFFMWQISGVSLEDKAKPLWHWAQTMASLRELFESGEAVKIGRQNS
jgi:superfamily I DNA and/or RNA helicase